jgi:hypothetical protein
VSHKNSKKLSKFRWSRSTVIYKVNFVYTNVNFIQIFVGPINMYSSVHVLPLYL